MRNKPITSLFNAAVFILGIVPIFAAAQNSDLTIPAEIKPFIGKNDHAVALEKADLNGDNTMDFILVTEKTTATINDDEAESGRTLMILTRDREGKLKLAKSNKQVVYCKSCGGAFGDPFEKRRSQTRAIYRHQLRRQRVALERKLSI